MLHEQRRRGQVDLDDAQPVLERLEDAPVRRRAHRRRRREAWWLADELGWAKTYDAE